MCGREVGYLIHFICSDGAIRSPIRLNILSAHSQLNPAKSYKQVIYHIITFYHNIVTETGIVLTIFWDNFLPILSNKFSRVKGLYRGLVITDSTSLYNQYLTNLPSLGLHCPLLVSMHHSCSIVCPFEFFDP